MNQEPNIYFTRRVAKSGKTGVVITIPKQEQANFPPGTKVLVKIIQ